MDEAELNTDNPLFSDSDFYLEGEFPGMNIYELKLEFAKIASKIANSKVQEYIEVDNE